MASLADAIGARRQRVDGLGNRIEIRRLMGGAIEGRKREQGLARGGRPAVGAHPPLRVVADMDELAIG
jgi:hypothetical protein